MLSVYKKVVITLLLASFASVACAQQNSLPEKYSKKILIEAKWGDGLGEFGISTTDMGPSGPTDFVVAPNGDIYILDNMGINVRIAKYDAEGNFKEYMYLYQAPVKSFKTEKEQIKYKYGHILAKARQDLLPQQIVVDKQGLIYLFQEQFSKILQYKWAGRPLSEITGVPRGRLKYESSQLLLTDGYVSADGRNQWHLLDSKGKLRIDFKSIAITKGETSKISTTRPPGSRQMLFYIDAFYNHYYYTYFTKTEKVKIHKYNKKGTLLAIIDVVENRSDMYAAPYRPELMYITDNGDIYYFITHREEAMLVKWHLEGK